MADTRERKIHKYKSMGSLPDSPHFVIFPFMAQGHTIPLLHLSRLLLRRSASVTIITTAANSFSIRAFLDGTPGVAILELPFPHNIEGVPPGVENTQHLPSMLPFLPFVRSTKLMQRSFENSLETLSPPVSCIISDGFLGWTVDSANRFGVPRFVFFGMGNFSSTMYNIMGRDRPHAETLSPDELFPMPGFPGRELTRNDFEPPFGDISPAGPYVEFMLEQLAYMAKSHGVIVNSFAELESSYADYWNANIGPRALNVGPLCMAEEKPKPSHVEKTPPVYVEFLDRKFSGGEPVLYVSFGTQARVAAEQLEEIAVGLERSEVSFLWVMADAKGVKIGNRGIVVNEWVDQLEVLRHGAVKGFLSHCGWNSVVESISAGVPMIALPFLAEQHINARFVAEEAGVGLRIMPEGGGSVRGFVAAEEVERVVRELMGDGEKGVEVRRKAAEYEAAARESMGEGGSSVRTLDMLVDEIRAKTVTFCVE